MTGMTGRVVGALVCANTCFYLIGCGPADHAFPPLHPVSGVVHVGSRPAAGGQLQLQASTLGEQMLLVQGVVSEQGEFTLSTTSAKIKKKLPGAPAGSYKGIYLPTSSDQQVMPIDVPGSLIVEEKDNRWTIKLRP